MAGTDTPAPTLTDHAISERDAAPRPTETKEDSKSADGFKRVSAAHASQCMDPQEVIDKVKAHTGKCKDHLNVHARNLKAEYRRIRFQDRFYQLHKVAIGHLASFGGRALAAKHKDPTASPGVRALRAYYLRRDAAGFKIFDAMANDMLEHIAELKKPRVLLRTYTDDESDFWRIDAILTTRYGIIDNLWFLYVLQEFVPKGRWSAVSYDGRDLSGHYYISDEARRDQVEMGGALAVGNSEIGRKSLTIRPSVFDWVSSCGFVFGQYEGDPMRRVHAGKIEADDLKESIREHIDAQIPLFDACIQNLEALKEIAVSLDEARRVIVDVGSTQSITNEEKLRWLAGIEEEVRNRGESIGLTAFGVAAGLAKAGLAAEDHGRDMELEQLAGGLATPRGRDKDLKQSWDRILTRARTMDDEKVSKVFGTGKE